MKSVVTGGTGFLGSYLVRRLVNEGKQVTVLCRQIPKAAEFQNVTYVQCPLSDRQGLRIALRSADEVFHVAAKVGAWGRWQEFYDTNVTGTKNIVAACSENNVARLIYTSSPSVIFDGTDHRGLDESYPYPRRAMSHYSYSKRLAEELVLAANGVGSLTSVALRPHLIWGVGDRYLIPRVLEQANRQKLRRVGNGKNLVDIIHVENAAEAHCAAARELARGRRCAGKAYFLNQERPVVLWDFIDEVLKRAGLAPLTKQISFKSANRIGSILEAVHRTLQLTGEPRLTPFLAHSLAKNHYYSSLAAKKDFGFTPEITIEQGLDTLFGGPSIPSRSQ